jgi:hypothetical protein
VVDDSTVFDTVFNLPVHVLVVHAIVVLGPLAALTAIVYAAWPASRRFVGWPLLAVTALATLSAYVATESGDELEDRLSEDPTVSLEEFARIEVHTDLGDAAYEAMLVFLAVAVVCVLWALAPRRTVPGPVRIVAAVALAGVAVWAGWAVVRAGHSGAEAVWLIRNALG